MNYPHQRWRLIISPASSGAWNMAVDEALLENINQKYALPCLRLYTWQPPCLSIGYAQSISDIDWERLSRFGWDWVRRPTGGRAILHTDELTYSVIAPLTEPRVKGSVLESYQRLSDALLLAINTLGIPAIANQLSTSTHSREAVCFEVPSNYEIVVGGKKLMGSAQARRKNGVIQHGTLPLWGDLTRINQVLAYSDESQRQEASLRLLAHATTVENILGRKIDWQTIVNAFIDGFESALNIGFIKLDLSEEELSSVNQLVRNKYTHKAWLERL